MFDGQFPLNGLGGNSTDSHKQKSLPPSINQGAIDVTPEKNVVNNGASDTLKTPSVQFKQGTSDVATDYFEVDEKGFLISKQPDYKGTSKKVQQDRFCVTYIWAYQGIHKAPVPSKEHIMQAAKLNGFYDKNFTIYLDRLAKTNFVVTDKTYKLNPGAQLKIAEILKEMQNPDLVGYDMNSQSKRSSKRAAKVNKDDERQIEEWLKMNSKYDNYDVRKFTKVLDWIFLALYDITKELKAVEAVKPSIAYKYLVARYRTVPVNSEAFRKTLASPSYNKKFNKTTEGLYYLTQDGEKEALQLLNA